MRNYYYYYYYDRSPPGDQCTVLILRLRDFCLIGISASVLVCPRVGRKLLVIVQLLTRLRCHLNLLVDEVLRV